MIVLDGDIEAEHTKWNEARAAYIELNDRIHRDFLSGSPSPPALLRRRAEIAAVMHNAREAADRLYRRRYFDWYIT
jgi:hypothetical protein